eukprot:TRINITY_DN27352_c0_g1_i1.p1 TRINITY_DN27352_c0_g1~~TRINITY_DN27352_c0_g1_i1.p1  ORF type:complete len:289 (+),score=51.95 TRINITY_DN27352_c0_g1_i1:241-1107(+)
MDQSQVVLTCLSDEAATDALLLGSSGIISLLKPGQLLIDLTHVSPATSMRCHISCAARGAHFVDAPVCGNPAMATNGNAPILAGGSDQALAAAAPILFGLSSNVHLIGGPGTGTAANLVATLVETTNKFVSCEVLHLANALGLPREQDWLLAVAGSSGITEGLERTLSEVSLGETSLSPGSHFQHGNINTGRRVKSASDGMHFVVAAADGLDTVIPIAEVVSGCLDLAMDRGLDRAGLSVLYHLMQDGTIPTPELTNPTSNKPPGLKPTLFPSPAQNLPMSPPHRWQR